MNRPGYLKAGAFILAFLLISGGRWIALPGTRLASLSAVFPVCSYGVIVAGIAVFTVDLILVRSLLQRKILYIQFLGAALVAVGAIDRVLEFSTTVSAISLLVSAALVGILIVLDTLRSGGPEFRFATTDRVPNRYLRRRPLKSIVTTLLRLFPFPEPVGLYRIGSPELGSSGGESPVLVTGNFELTLRRVCSALKDRDCWLLVCDSRGVNVWCASMAGYLATDSVVQAIHRTGLAERVKGRRLIIPQLCASAVSPEELKRRTGFSARFGPLYINDLDRYVEDPSDPSIRRAVFPLRARLEMALGSPLLLSVVLALIYNFIGLGHLLIVMPLLYLASLLQGLIFPKRPLRRIGAWAILYGAAALLLTGLLSHALFPEYALLYALTVGTGAAYLVTEFSGWSPLLKYSLFPRKKPNVRVDRDACSGCLRCVEVCPRAVFRMEGGRSAVVAGERCVICRSCFRQCPSGAVVHSHDHSAFT